MGSFDWHTLKAPNNVSGSKEEKAASVIAKITPSIEEVLELVLCFDESVKGLCKTFRAINQSANEYASSSATKAIQAVYLPFLKKYSDEVTFFKSGGDLPTFQKVYDELVGEEGGDPNVRAFKKNFGPESKGEGGSGANSALETRLATLEAAIFGKENSGKDKSGKPCIVNKLSATNSRIDELARLSRKRSGDIPVSVRSVCLRLVV